MAGRERLASTALTTGPAKTVEAPRNLNAVHKRYPDLKTGQQINCRKRGWRAAPDSDEHYELAIALRHTEVS